MRDDDLDRVIDDVAREMTAGEPDGAFTAQVLARIESGDEARRRWPAALIIAPLAAAAAIVAVMVSRSAGPEGPALQQATASRPVQEARTAYPELRTENREPRTKNREPRTPNLERRTPNPDASRASDVAAMAPPLLTVDSIELEPIGSSDSLQLPQLETPPSLDIAPLENLEPRTENQEREREPGILNPEP